MELLKDLNSAQTQAVTHRNGPVLIVAGAGTGKTAVITRRIAWLIEQNLAKPEEILALTFTDKAATEMEERVDKLLPYGYVNTWISTFHAFGERILHDYALEIGLPSDFRVLSSSEQWMLMRNNLEKFALNYWRPLGNPTKFIHALLQHFSRAKDELVAPADYLKHVKDLELNADSESHIRLPAGKAGVGSFANAQDDDKRSDIARLKEVAEAYHVYEQLLLENSAFDFGDLIRYAYKLLTQRPRVTKELRRKFKYILVDEFQDTNVAQYELVKLLSTPANNLTVVGDDDQSVYAFRGASMSNILHFAKDFPNCKKVFLNENYRSYQNILDLTHTFIQQNNPYRLEAALSTSETTLSKKLEAHRDGAGEIAGLAFHTAEDEAQGVIKKILELYHGRHPERSEGSPTNVGQRAFARDSSASPQNDIVSWRDFAILVRANSSAPIFLQQLRAAGIPFEYVANRGLYSEAIILEVLAYLKLLDNYHESEALYQVLTCAPFVFPHRDLVTLAHYANKKTISLYSALQAQEARLMLSEEGKILIDKLLAQLSAHSALAKEKSAAEVYVRVIHDLGIEERVAHPALARDAQYLAAFYSRIQRFGLEQSAHSLNAFLKHLALELESGEEGQLPQDFEEGPDTVKVITVHAAKGLEWRYVFIPHLIDRRFPSVERREPIELPAALIKETLPEGDVHLQEERRLFYVAMTRARDGLYLTRAQDYFGKSTRKPSRFLFELGMADPSPQPSPARGEGVFRKVPSPLMGEGQGEGGRYPIPDHFSFSAISAFRKCPLEYKFRYLLKLPAPGSAQLSFGNTIHKTLELFLKLWQQRMSSVQGDLFGNRRDCITLPTRAELDELYSRNWIDDWYESASQKNEYRKKRGPQVLANFYEHFTANLPKPKYLESWFKIAMGPYKFVGKIDRIDGTEGGATIIDYKTGELARTKLEKVDKDQLILYQIAAQEFLRENIVGASYWYLVPNEFTEPFVATPKEIEKLKQDYTEQIERIVQTIQADDFAQMHADAGHHDCNYAHLL